MRVERAACTYEGDSEEHICHLQQESVIGLFESGTWAHISSSNRWVELRVKDLRRSI